MKALILKTHVEGYMRKDGTYVQAHEDKRRRHADLASSHLYSMLAEADDSGGFSREAADITKGQAIILLRGELIAEHSHRLIMLRLPFHECGQGDGEVRKALLLKASRRRPTPAMLLAGNYRKKKMNWRGLDISIETEKGAQRSGVDPGGQPWSVTMQHDYGYIRRTKAADDEQLDCYIGPNRDATHVYVVHQHKVGDWDQYDEDKCMLDFESKRDAITAYLAHYSDARFLGGVTSVPVDEFIKLAKGTAKLPRAKRRLHSESSLSSHLGI